MTNRTILILGGGIGGIVAARELRRHLGPHHRIVLIDKYPVFSFPASFLWIMAGWRTSAAIQRPRSLLGKYGIEFLQTTVTSIDPGSHAVTTDRGKLDYDYLIIALGAEKATDSVPGLGTAFHTTYTLGGAEQLHRALSAFSGKTAVIVIAGLSHPSPPAPYETAFLMHSFFSRRGLDDIRIALYTPERTPLPAAGSDVGVALTELCHARGIDLHVQHRLECVDPDSRQVVFTNGRSVSFDLLVAIPPYNAPAAVRESGLVDPSGWINADERTFRTTFTDVYAIGDVTGIRIPDGHVLPKLGSVAHNEAEIVALHIAAGIQGGTPVRTFTGEGYCFLETGYNQASYVSGNFFTHPEPSFLFHEPSAKYHWAKVVYEKYWLWRWF